MSVIYNVFKKVYSFFPWMMQVNDAFQNTYFDIPRTICHALKLTSVRSETDCNQVFNYTRLTQCHMQ